MTARPSHCRRTLVLGGTGFIGTNLASALITAQRVTLVVGRHPRQGTAQASFAKADVRDDKSLRRMMRDFAPSEVIHLAARTDFVSWEDPDGFQINTEGTANVVRAVRETASVRRFIYASSHVAKGAPPNGAKLYAQSKLAAEGSVREANLERCVWTIIRPCSIWGPWCRAPFLPFFVAIARGRYFHLGRSDPPKRIGYVGNTCHQIVKLLDAPPALTHKRTIYLADYQLAHIRSWAEMVAKALRVRIPGTLPEPVVRVAARAGDLLRFLGARNPPLSSSRLANMRADTSHIDTDEIQRIAGPVPFALEQGVELTVRWLRESGILS
jgi:nucleoside-diphosphate-sugar epimerase